MTKQRKDKTKLSDWIITIVLVMVVLAAIVAVILGKKSFDRELNNACDYCGYKKHTDYYEPTRDRIKVECDGNKYILIMENIPKYEIDKWGEEEIIDYEDWIICEEKW